MSYYPALGIGPRRALGKQGKQGIGRSEAEGLARAGHTSPRDRTVIVAQRRSLAPLR